MQDSKRQIKGTRKRDELETEEENKENISPAFNHSEKLTKSCPKYSAVFKTGSGKIVQPSTRRVIEMGKWLDKAWEQASGEEINAYLQFSQLLLSDEPQEISFQKFIQSLCKDRRSSLIESGLSVDSLYLSKVPDYVRAEWTTWQQDLKYVLLLSQQEIQNAQKRLQDVISDRNRQSKKEQWISQREANLWHWLDQFLAGMLKNPIDTQKAFGLGPQPEGCEEKKQISASSDDQKNEDVDETESFCDDAVGNNVGCKDDPDKDLAINVTKSHLDEFGGNAGSEDEDQEKDKISLPCRNGQRDEDINAVHSSQSIIG